MLGPRTHLVPPAGPGLDIPRASSRQQGWIDSARALLDDALVRDLVVEAVSVASPTGQEAELAGVLAARLESLGLEGRYQPIDATQGNATGRLRGTGTGDDLLLYAPIDTLTTGDPAEDLPLVGGPTLRRDMLATASEEDGFVVGLGASNPKGHGAAIVAAVDAVRRAGIPLAGDVVIALCAGGMPTENRPLSGLDRRNSGQGSGAAFFLDRGGWADHAIICKPGWAAHWEEVGLAWFELRVSGTYNYVGSRHRIPYSNPIVASADVVRDLDAWFLDYAARWTDGLVAPQGNIGSIDAGWPHLLSVSPGVCRIRFDLRTNPRMSMMEARREVAAVVADIAARHGLEIEWDMVLSIPGSYTDPDEWIVRSAIASWEDREGRPHEPIVANSGATDANILRAHGIPTARIGMQRAGEGAPLEPDFPRGMNVVELAEVRRLAETLIHSIVLTCTPPPEQN